MTHTPEQSAIIQLMMELDTAKTAQREMYARLEALEIVVREQQQAIRALMESAAAREADPFPHHTLGFSTRARGVTVRRGQ